LVAVAAGLLGEADHFVDDSAGFDARALEAHDHPLGHPHERLKVRRRHDGARRPAHDQEHRRDVHEGHRVRALHDAGNEQRAEGAHDAYGGDGFQGVPILRVGTAAVHGRGERRLFR